MYTCHSAFAESEGPSIQSHITIKLRKMVRAFLIARSERPILTVSESVRECVARMGIPSNEAVTLYNGIDIEHWQRTNGTPVLKQEFNLPEDAILVGTVARIAEVKDLPTLFQVVMRVHDKHPNAYFVIVGDGEGNELEKARNQVRELGLGSHVLFTGHRSDLLNVYASLDVFLMTSVSEGLPNTVLEAMAMEVPVVGTAVGGVPELVVNGETGFLCGVKDVQGLADKVDDVIADRKLRSELAKAGRRRICTLFSFDKRVRELESYYEYF